MIYAELIPLDQYDEYSWSVNFLGRIDNYQEIDTSDNYFTSYFAAMDYLADQKMIPVTENFFYKN